MQSKSEKLNVKLGSMNATRALYEMSKGYRLQMRLLDDYPTSDGVGGLLNVLGPLKQWNAQLDHSQPL